MADGPGLAAIRCDGTQVVGMGHVMRCLALAEGLTQLGMQVVFLGAISDASAREHVRRLGSRRLDAPPDARSLLLALRRLRAEALVIDSYDVGSDVYAEIRDAGLAVVGIVDAPSPHLAADLLVNQNLGAEAAMGTRHRGRVLAGPQYALLRSLVTARRAAAPEAAVVARRVLVVLGGTDVSGSAPQVAACLLATGQPVHVDVVCANDTLRRQAAALPTGLDQSLAALPPLNDLPAAAALADLVVSGAGTTALELACLGKPMALIVVADNQHEGYLAMLSAGAAAGLGTVARLAEEPGVVTLRLRELLASTDDRTALARAAHRLVDGLGRDRVAAEVQALVRTA